MLNSLAKLEKNIFSAKAEMRPTRDGFGTGVVLAGRADTRVVVLTADLKESVRAESFEKEFPERFVEMGIAEQNMAAVASGLAAAGKIPFVTSYACFNPGRNYEQIRTTIALNRMPVKICGMHAGVSVGPDGATHQMLEDIGMMRMLPGMTVISPGDAIEAEKATVAVAKYDGPAYLRFGRAPTTIFTTDETPFVIGEATKLWDSDKPQIAFIATGAQSHTALVAARALAESGTESVVLHVPTIKPLDEDAVLDAARRAGRVITVEEHQIAGGFGSAVAELLSEKHPIPIKRLGIRDAFGQSGTPEELISHYGLNALHIIGASHELLSL